jgi:hypothetical protein
MHPIQDLFLESFSYVLQFDMHSSVYKKIYSCKKWVLHRRTARKFTGRLPVGQLAPQDVPQPQESQPDVPQEASPDEEPFEIELVIPEGPTAQDSPAKE